MFVVLLGSKSPHKYLAVKAAINNLGITPSAIVAFDVDSGVPRQPEGIIQAHRGAADRAVIAWMRGWAERDEMAEKWGGERDVISIGLESVIAPINDVPVDDERQRHVETGLCVVHSGLEENIVSVIPGQMLDPKDVTEARHRGFDKCIVTDVTRERTGQCEPTDSTPYHTGNRVTRVDCLELAARIAISQYLTRAGRIADPSAILHNPTRSYRVPAVWEIAQIINDVRAGWMERGVYQHEAAEVVRYLMMDPKERAARMEQTLDEYLRCDPLTIISQDHYQDLRQKAASAHGYQVAFEEASAKVEELQAQLAIAKGVACPVPVPTIEWKLGGKDHDGKDYFVANHQNLRFRAQWSQKRGLWFATAHKFGAFQFCARGENTPELAMAAMQEELVRRTS